MKNRSDLFLSWCIAILIMLPLLSQGQDDDRKARFDVGLDLVSRYVWRGTDFGNSPSIQPEVSFSVAGFKIGAWGAYGLGKYSTKINDSTTIDNGNYAEMDLFASYSWKFITIGVTDYFLPNGLNPNQFNKYFRYDAGKTGHLMEGSITLNGPDKFPIQFYAGTMFFGSDKREKISGNDTTMVNNYSTYLELSYPFSVKGIDLSLFAGATTGQGVYMPDGSEGFNFVNTGITASKTIRITESFSLPVSASLIANPQAENVFLVIGISL